MEAGLKLELTGQSLGFILPELTLSIGILALLIAGLITKKFPIAKVFAIAITALNAITLITDLPSSEQVNLFNGMLTLDNFSFWMRVTIALTGLAVVLMSQSTTAQKYTSEYFVLLITIILGGQLLVMSNHMVMVIISLELMSIPAYVLAGFAFTKESAEASMKYFIYGSVSTAFMIFGMTWLYGLGKGLELSSPAFIDQLGYHNNVALFTAGLFFAVGLLFKMAASPFHFWAPDVYQATPYHVLALFSIVPKIAAGAVLLKAISWFSLNGQSRYDWQTVACAFALLTLAVGNFSAIWQKNVKRMMAYSSIGQAGFLLLAISIQTKTGTTYFLFYAFVLAIGTVLVFTMLDFFQTKLKASVVTEFAGLGRQNVLASVLLTIGLLSLTGLPITAGFTAKLLVFSELLTAWEVTGKPIMLILFVFGLVNTVVALYYYLQVPYFMFIKERPVSDEAKLNWLQLSLGFILMLGLFLFFMKPSLAFLF